jgi:hypothetical protein
MYPTSCRYFFFKCIGCDQRGLAIPKFGNHANKDQLLRGATRKVAEFVMC